jgi:hypothetical protein
MHEQHDPSGLASIARARARPPRRSAPSREDPGGSPGQYSMTSVHMLAAQTNALRPIINHSCMPMAGLLQMQLQLQLPAATVVSDPDAD